MRPGGGRFGGSRFLDVRMALFWLGAAVWLTGILLKIDLLTIVAIVILFAALLLGLIARRMAESEMEAEEGEGLDP